MLCCAALELPGVECSRGYIQHWHGQGNPIPEKSAQRILTDALDWLPEDLSLSLRVYGHQHAHAARNCQDSELLVQGFEDTAQAFAVGDFNFADVEGDALASIAVSNLALASGDTLTVDQGSGAVAVTNGLTITAAQIPSLTYIPAANANGTGGAGIPLPTAPRQVRATTASPDVSGY